MASSEGFSLHVTVWIDPSNVDEFKKHMQPVYDMVISQPECEYFEIFQGTEDPGQLSWVENWYDPFCITSKVTTNLTCRSKSFGWFKEVSNNIFG